MTIAAAALYLSLAMGISWAVTRWVRRHAGKLGLIQLPNARSSHSSPTPQGGGLGVVAGCTAVCLWIGGGAFAKGFFGLAFLLAMMGLRDDIRPLPIASRLAAQLLACGVLLIAVDPGAPDFLPIWLWYGALLVFGLWWINLFNFMDGIDGIAGSQAVFMLIAAAALSGPYAPSHPEWWWMPVMAAAALGFLLHNWPPAKIFMGDAGSTYLAFLIFGMALLSLRAGWMHETAWLILGAVFITDATLTLARRMMAKERWFEAHRRHAYQHLARRWGSHRRVTLAVLAVNVLWLAPLAWASLETIAPAWLWLALAYGPLVAAAIISKAGRDEEHA